MTASALRLTLEPTAPLAGLTLRAPARELTADPARPIPLEIRRPEGAWESDPLTIHVEGGTVAPPAERGHAWNIWTQDVEKSLRARLTGRCEGHAVVVQVVPDRDERELVVQAQWGDQSGTLKLALHPSFKQTVRETLESIIYAFFIAILLRTFLFQAFYIPSESMVPTLEVKDRLVASKFIYRLREPVLGEIIIFKVYQHKRSGAQTIHIDPQDRDQYTVKDYIKRVIGRPGDTVEVYDGQVLVNGTAIEEPYLAPDVALRMNNEPPEVVAAGEYFVMGDNRMNSKDSRFIGTIPRESIVGKAYLVFWPLDRLKWLQ